ncbi:cupredoxin domain-containing protein [Candidatus Woesearchaeota archaeon]|nr:cupredoxin domain-containing protein [Candidatus Woesearchaeota archaeon]
MSKNLLKLFSAILMLSLLFIAACSSSTKTVPESSGGGSPVSENPVVPISEDQAKETAVASDTTKADQTTDAKSEIKQETPQTNAAEPLPQTVTPADTQVKEITMKAKAWAFEPNTIELNKGDKVKLTVTAVDVKHGISIFGINKKLEPNKPEVIEFTADEAGEFPFFCTVFCGDGHGSMKGMVVVR